MTRVRAPHKPRQRTVDKINLLVRLEFANPLMNSTAIAALCGLSIHQFSVLKKTPTYQAIHNVYSTGLFTSLDLKISDGYVSAQNTLAFAVPIALQGILNQALNAKDERVKNKAYNDILDRDGHFAKVSRIGAATPEQGGVAEDKDNKAVMEMISAMRTGQQSTNKPPASIDTPPLTESTQ
jgi:hypothetical protein